MKKNLFILCPILLVSIGIALVRDIFNATDAEPLREVKRSAVISCAPDTDERVFADVAGKYISILPGWGSHTYQITTASDNSQMYFDQGLSMYYSYHMKEAIASFKEAAKFDSACAMVYWGQALAMGPTYNSGYNYIMGSGVPAIMKRMNQYKEQASAKEKHLITAMNRRYNLTDTTDKQRKQLNEDYVEALKPLVEKYPDDLDIKALYIDAGASLELLE